MGERPYVVLSCAMSVDGYIDDSSDARLLLSNDADFDRVDAERAASDAILVGANTIRRDNPRLLVRSAARQKSRQESGLPPHPAKVTVTRRGDLSPEANFFQVAGEKLVYCSRDVLAPLTRALAPTATVIDAGLPLDLGAVLDDLGLRGIQRLLVEGGGAIHTQFLAHGLADELQLAVAPLIVGDPAAPRFVGAGAFPHTARTRLTLADVRTLDDVVVLRYLLGEREPVTPGPGP